MRLTTFRRFGNTDGIEGKRCHGGLVDLRAPGKPNVGCMHGVLGI